MALGNLNRVDKSTTERWVYVYKLTRNVEVALECNTYRYMCLTCWNFSQKHVAD